MYDRLNNNNYDGYLLTNVRTLICSVSDVVCQYTVYSHARTLAAVMTAVIPNNLFVLYVRPYGL